MLKHAKGNLIDMAENGDFDFVVHGCNYQNTMGSGFAKELRARYPAVYEADTLATKQWREPVAKLGNFSSYTTVNKKGDALSFINAYTQLHYLPRGIDHFEYESFYLILRKLASFKNARFGFPYIGMGLAGGNSERIISLISNFADSISEFNSEVTLVEFAQ